MFSYFRQFIISSNLHIQWIDVLLFENNEKEARIDPSKRITCIQKVAWTEHSIFAQNLRPD